MNTKFASSHSDLDDLVDQVGIALQITPSQFEDAESKYHAVGEHLNADDSSLADYDPQIYAQGSFRLDTTVRPMSHTEFDIDLVCLLSMRDVSPSEAY